MLKLGKGHKKKKSKKGKKGKDDELFTEEELQQYRKEHAKTTEEAVEHSEQSSSAVASEEFEKFKLLTAGVDDILKKTQGDLDRIKKDSFFQRKPTPSELQAQEEKEREERERSEGNWVGFEDKKGNFEKERLDVPQVDDDESESEYEDTDDIFDTAYVDALESGEVKLAHVPDDDELGFNDGPDPFDTTTADAILKKAEEEEKRRKKEIQLASAVHILSGRADRDKAFIENGSNQEKRTVKQRPRKIQDFCLLGSFDSTNVDINHDAVEALDVVNAPKSLLDDDVDSEIELPTGDILIQEVLIKQAKKPDTPKLEEPLTGEASINDLVEEFENNSVEPEIQKLEEEDDFDEFSALAQSSIINQKLEDELSKYVDEEDDPFDTSVVNTVLNSEKGDIFGSLEGKIENLPPVAVFNSEKTDWSAFGESPKEVDPFDTTFVGEKALPGKTELKLIEQEILNAPLPAPKKVEIPWEARILSRNNSEFSESFDFNPREDEEPNRQQKVSIQITNPSGETHNQRGSDSEDIVALSLKHRDLLGGSTTDLSSLGDDPLPPSVTSPTEDLSRFSDPFDTAIAEQATAPGRAELRCIETELLSDIRSSISDEDFDPRSDEQKNSKVSFEIPSPGSDLLSIAGEGGSGVRPLTPYYADPESLDFEAEPEDPFDTSHVTSAPGKHELRLIEQELESAHVEPISITSVHQTLGIVEKTKESNLTTSLSDEDFNPRDDETNLQVTDTLPLRRHSEIVKTNTPTTLILRTSNSVDKPDYLDVDEQIPIKVLTPTVEEDINSYIDPFDTSIAENIGPGKAELKLLEGELVGSLVHSISDQDFDPRGASVTKVTQGILKAVPSTKPLEPIEIHEELDPFDTSIASDLAPGKAELRLLESELVG